MAVNDIFFASIWYGCAGNVLQVSNRNSVVRDEIEAVDICGDLLGRGENLGGFLDLYAETMMMEVALEPIVTMIAVSQETKVAYFHDLIS